MYYDKTKKYRDAQLDVWEYSATKRWHVLNYPAWTGYSIPACGPHTVVEPVSYPEGTTVRATGSDEIRTRGANGDWLTSRGNSVNTDRGVDDGLRSGFYDRLTLPTPYAYEPGDVLKNSSGSVFVVSKDHRAYTVTDDPFKSISIPSSGREPFADVTHVNDEPLVPPNPLDEAVTGRLAHSDNKKRTYVRLPDGWVLATVDTNTSIRGTLQGGNTGARIYTTDELPADTKLVK